jgi:hypothetical protein
MCEFFKSALPSERRKERVAISEDRDSGNGLCLRSGSAGCGYVIYALDYWCGISTRICNGPLYSSSTVQFTVWSSIPTTVATKGSISPAKSVAFAGVIVTVIFANVEDILWADESYQAVYGEAGLLATQVFKPLAGGDEPYSWVNETKIPPWVIYVLKRATQLCGS